MYRKDFKIGLNLTGGSVDDPDQQLYESYGCGSPRNYTGYCNPGLEKLFEQQSAEADDSKRKRLVWQIERKLPRTVRGRSSSTTALCIAGNRKSRAGR
jgi:peptide/nickel transport system substrate-binding protein